MLLRKEDELGTKNGQFSERQLEVILMEGITSPDAIPPDHGPGTAPRDDKSIEPVPHMNA